MSGSRRFLFAAEFAAVYSLIGAGGGTFESSGNLVNSIPDNRPVICGKRHDGESSSREVLLINQAPVAGYKHLNPLLFSGAQEFSVLQSAPTHPGSGNNLMLCCRDQRRAKFMRQVVVEQNLHATR